MSVLLYRRSLDARSGAGQLMRMQAEGLESVGEKVTLACERGALKFALRTGRRARRAAPAQVEARRDGTLLVDHGMNLRQPHVVFVHNLYTEAARFVPHTDWVEAAAEEARYFARLAADVPIVANSELVKSAMLRSFDLAEHRISVCHPGYDAVKFQAMLRPQLRREARQALSLDEQTPLVGFVTSGDFHKRGLDVFLHSAVRMLETRPSLHFLVVGSKRLPASADARQLVAARKLSYRAKNSRPELWMAALDVFAYPARFEEFGLVVAEAQALGIPIVTSRRVGAAEILPSEYRNWLLDEPELEPFTTQVLKLLDDEAARRDLVAAGKHATRGHDRDRYVASTIATILAQKPRLK